MIENNNIKILIVDKKEADFIRIRDLLTEVKHAIYELDWISDYDTASTIVKKNLYQVYLFDYRLGQYTGLELLQEAIKAGSKAPVIMLAEQTDQAIDFEAMKLGAADFLIKKEISTTLLERSIRYAIKQKRLGDELFQAKERAVVTLESIGDSVIITDPTGKIDHLNRIAEKITGWTDQDVKGLFFFDVINIVNEKNFQTVINPIDEVVQYNRIVKLPGDSLLINRYKKQFAVEGTVSPIHNPENRIIGIVIILHDISEFHELSKKISFQASHDFLTGLFNRLKFEEKLKALIEQVRETSEEHYLLYLDLDQFKIVNDTCGHYAGDHLLKQISALMKELIRNGDIIARIGGDEFGIILVNITLESACEIASKLCKAVQDFRFVWNKKLFTIGVSIGVVVINHKTKDIDHILSLADQSCYIIKDRGGNNFHVYNEDDQELSERHGAMQWMSEIARSFEENLFCLYYQPIIPSVRKRHHDWYELLIRIIDEKGKLILPSVFLPSALRYNMMPTIDRWVINTFFSIYQKNASLLKNSGAIFNINISGASLINDFFLGFFTEQFYHYQIPPGVICFEITESSAMSNFNDTVKIIENLKKLGCLFALDDFGGGLSSFNYLRFLPIDYIKINGSFVKNVTKSIFDHTMVLTINRLAHFMGIKTIAEFVESKSIYNKIKGMGIDFVQGEWTGKPLPIDHLFNNMEQEK